MYEATSDRQFFFTPNALGRYAIGDRTTGLVRNPDGGLDIWIGRHEPGGERRANWLPAPASGPFTLTLRAYLPDAELLDQAWAMARTLAAGAPAALANTKRLLWNGLGQGVEAAMPEENQAQEMLSGTNDAREGLAAVIEKRKPNFTGN